jgi:integrin beta 1
MYLQLKYDFLCQPFMYIDICSAGLTCGQCIKLNADCGWCSGDNYPSSRCSSPNNLIKSGCPNRSIEFPVNKIEIKVDQELSRFKVASEDEAIQVKPQLIRLDLRLNKVETINLSYKQAVDYPVDLYYLMDLSKTMSAHKKTLATLANELANQMRLITKNFRLGFGSFIDKSIQPYTDTNPQK